MIQALKDIWINPYVRVLVILIGLLALLMLLYLSRVVWGTFLAAFLLAYLLNPLVTWFERRRFHRIIGVLIVLVLFVLLIGLFWYIGIAVAAQFSDFIAELPELVERLEEVPFRIGRLIDPSFGALFQQVFMSVQRLAELLANELLPSLAGLQDDRGIVWNLIALAGGGLQVAIVLVLSLYLLYRFPVYGESFLRIVPERHQPLVEELIKKASFSVGGYIRGQLLIAAMVGIMVWIGLAGVGIPLAGALGMIAAIFNIIPFFGPLIATVPAVVLALTIGWGEVIGTLLVLLLANQIDAHLLTPLVLSKTISVDPVTIILAILFGAALFGLWGAVIAVPAAVFLKLLYKDYYLQSAWYREQGGLGLEYLVNKRVK